MQLSTAIRLGAMIRPQGFGAFFVRHGTDLASCALGSAAEASGMQAAEDENVTTLGCVLRAAFGDQIERRTRCPVPCLTNYVASVGYVIAHLNDDHRWTREQIADWVASVERLTQPAPDAAVDPALADLGRTSTRDRVGVS